MAAKDPAIDVAMPEVKVPLWVPFIQVPGELRAARDRAAQNHTQAKRPTDGHPKLSTPAPDPWQTPTVRLGALEVGVLVPGAP